HPVRERTDQPFPLRYKLGSSASLLRPARHPWSSSHPHESPPPQNIPIQTDPCRSRRPLLPNGRTSTRAACRSGTLIPAPLPNRAESLAHRREFSSFPDYLN